MPRPIPPTLRLAAQNVARRPARALLLGTAVALAAGVGFAAFVVAWSVADAWSRDQARGGADLMIVPRDALVHLSSSLVAAPLTDATVAADVPARVAAIAGVARASRQRIVHADVDGKPIHVIAFDPATDFTVAPWLRAPDDAALPIDAVIAGGLADGLPGEAIRICGQPLRVHAKLRPSGVHPLDDAFLVSFVGLDRLAAMCARDAPARGGHAACAFDRLDEATAVLVTLAPGARKEDVTLALSSLSGVKVVEGNATARASRDALRLLMTGIAALAAGMAVALVVLVSLLFAAIVGERQREIGVLRAIGATPGQVVAMLVAEAAVVTGIGGALGVALGVAILSLVARSLGFGLEALGVPLAWPPAAMVVVAAFVAALVSAALGVAGAWLPAWRAQRREPYAMVGGAS